MTQLRWEDAPHWWRVMHLMRGLRGNWGEGRQSAMLKLLYSELEASEAEAIADSDWLRAVKANADAFDGHFRDGRIFRDGQSFIPASTARPMGFPESPEDPKGLVGVSGNLASWVPGYSRRMQAGGWFGSYNEEPVKETPLPPPGNQWEQCPAEDCLEHEE